jgi:putative endonuclease
MTNKPPPLRQAIPPIAPHRPAPTTTASGTRGEDTALALLERHGLRLLVRNFRTPGRGGGEIDLIMQDPDGTLVFVEVRKRSSERHGGAGASITAGKKRRLIFAAQHYLLRQRSLPPCRFDVVLIDSETVWLKAAFDASGYA